MPSSSQWLSNPGTASATVTSNSLSFSPVRPTNRSLPHRISPVFRSNTSIGSGAYSMLLERAVSMPPLTRSRYCRTLCWAMRLRRTPTYSTSADTSASATASSGEKGKAAITKAARHIPYSMILVRKPRISFLLKQDTSFQLQWGISGNGHLRLQMVIPLQITIIVYYITPFPLSQQQKRSFSTLCPPGRSVAEGGEKLGVYNGGKGVL